MQEERRQRKEEARIKEQEEWAEKERLKKEQEEAEQAKKEPEKLKVKPTQQKTEEDVSYETSRMVTEADKSVLLSENKKEPEQEQENKSPVKQAE